MSRALSPSSGQPYGLARVCRIWRVARASVYRHRKPQPDRQRRGPVGPLPDPELTAEIRAVLAASPFHGEGHRKVWARLRMKGIRTSLRRVLRLMREHDLLAPSRTGSPRGPRNHDGTIIPETIDTLWGTDMTTAWTSRRTRRRVRGGGSPQCRVRRHSCQSPGHAFRGSRAAAPGCARALRRLCQRDCFRPVGPARPRQPVHVAGIPG